MPTSPSRSLTPLKLSYPESGIADRLVRGRQGSGVGLSEKRCEYVRVRLAPPSMAEPKPRRDALRRFLETHPCLLAAPEAWPEGPEPLNTRIKNEKGADRSHGPKPGHRPEQPAPLVPAGRSTLLQAGHHG